MYLVKDTDPFNAYAIDVSDIRRIYIEMPEISSIKNNEKVLYKIRIITDLENLENLEKTSFHYNENLSNFVIYESDDFNKIYDVFIKILRLEDYKNECKSTIMLSELIGNTDDEKPDEPKITHINSDQFGYYEGEIEGTSNLIVHGNSEQEVKDNIEYIIKIWKNNKECMEKYDNKVKECGFNGK